ncbi:putative glycerol kinase 5 [Patiria miniata]|uniref:Glycerol kinase 5 n=1 Tax=Patiria miniata TaxID=46514 RepID=A0A913ZG94_PATMI|nr:putative glycerol kinase 5 [Patiria miniata]XP_038050071.1 putative glycerol kinase 5 [Patiria miniata]XP_038050072.1 putative glycerol kinase 5 [Patiria miniata]XP_038050073.1 putative glycerol kinase 5 [Patiria miniata]
MATQEAYIAAIDIGTTTLRCHIYNEKAEIKGIGVQKTSVHRPSQGMVEILPDVLWEKFTTAVKDAITQAKLEPEQVVAMGISTLRATFITWNRETGEPYHNFICWNDTRAEKLAKTINQSASFWCLRKGSKLVHIFSRMQRFEAGSIFQFMSLYASIKLYWVLLNIPGVKEDALENKVLFGTIETWLVWKLTKGKVHATDLSNIASTSLYDLYNKSWNTIHMRYLGIPLSMMPEIKDTSGDFGECDPEVFGASIPIRAVVGDQQGSSFGQCCFREGEVKVTMGTGTFLVMNTGSKICLPVNGVYPTIGWKIGDEIVYQLECQDTDAGTVIEWGLQMGLYETPAKSVEVANSVEDAGGVCFVPAFYGLQAPINDYHACCSLIGLRPSTTPAHITRASLESIAFRLVQLYNTATKRSGTKVRPGLRFDGGVSNNDFIVQLVSNLLVQKIDRPCNLDMSCLGAAFLAGLGAGVWKSKEELIPLRATQAIFEPEEAIKKYEPICRTWMRAVNRSLNWYV